MSDLISYAIGLDLGTSACKGVAVVRDGRVLAESRHDYGMSVGQPGWAEQDPADWWHAVATCVRTLSERLVPAHGQPNVIGVTGQMHGLVVADAAGGVIRPCMLWCDYRATHEALQVAELVGQERLEEITCNDARPAFTASKLLWLRAHEPWAYARIAHILLPKDWIVHRLTGNYGSEPSDASGTSMFDVHRGEWSAEIIERLNLDLAWFPAIRRSTAVVGELTEGAAGALGLAPGIPVIAGAGDQAAAAVASGAIERGVIACSLGTSAALTTTLSEPARDTFAHAVPGRWLLLNSMHAGGINLEWWATIAGGRQSSDASAVAQLATLAASCPPGAGGVTYLPFLSGERDWDSSGSLFGSFSGLRIEHGPAHLARAVLEGVCYELRRMLQAWRDRSVGAEVVRLSGGGAQLATWVQILADVLGMPIEVMPKECTGAFGAALLAFQGIGLLPSLEEHAMRSGAMPVATIPRAVAEHEEAYRRYVSLYEQQKGLSPATS